MSDRDEKEEEKGGRALKNRNTAWCPALYLLLTCGVESTYGAVAEDGGVVPVDSGVIAGSVELNPADGSVSVPAEMDATITAPLTSASLPADGFDSTVDSEQVFDISTPAAQITSPDVTVVNYLVVPVRLEISSVPEARGEDIQPSEKSSDDVEQSFRLVDTLSGVSLSGTAILALGTQDKIYNSREEFRRYAICPGRMRIFVAEISADGEAVIRLYGKVSPDFYGEFGFIARPALKISTVRAGELADLYRRQNKEQKKDI